MYLIWPQCKKDSSLLAKSLLQGTMHSSTTSEVSDRQPNSVCLCSPRKNSEEELLVWNNYWSQIIPTFKYLRKHLLISSFTKRINRTQVCIETRKTDLQFSEPFFSGQREWRLGNTSCSAVCYHRHYHWLDSTVSQVQYSENSDLKNSVSLTVSHHREVILAPVYFFN